jgi:hypothetical protein
MVLVQKLMLIPTVFALELLLIMNINIGSDNTGLSTTAHHTCSSSEITSDGGYEPLQMNFSVVVSV